MIAVPKIKQRKFANGDKYVGGWLKGLVSCGRSSCCWKCCTQQHGTIHVRPYVNVQHQWMKLQAEIAIHQAADKSDVLRSLTGCMEWLLVCAKPYTLDETLAGTSSQHKRSLARHSASKGCTQTCTQLQNIPYAQHFRSPTLLISQASNMSCGNSSCSWSATLGSDCHARLVLLLQPEGEGRYEWADGSSYEGGWKVRPAACRKGS